MATSKRNTSAVLALDGPSALILYRDRDAAEDLRVNDDKDDSAETDNQHDSNSFHHDESSLLGDKFEILDSEDFSLSDEDILAILDEQMVFVLPSESERQRRKAGQGDDDKDSPLPLPALSRTRLQSFTNGTSHSRDLKQIPYDELGVRKPNVDSPLYLIVKRSQARRRVMGVHVRTCAKAPRNALRKLGTQVLVPKPEFTFLLLAKYLNLVDLVRVGMELCGHYRLTGAPSNDLLMNKGVLYGQQSLTTVERLREFAEAAGSFPGAKLALRACRHIVNHSASPMETVLYMLLCLPLSMGGYALPRPALNAKRAVNKRAGAITFSRNLVPDLYWASARLDMEYDSEQFHSNPESLRKGARRTLALRAMNVEVISITSDIIHDEDAFEASVHLAARALHVHTRRPSAKALRAREALRNVLLFCDKPHEE